ncbi:MAG: sensor histidine kinase [Rhodothermales bacterium]
MNPPTRRWLKWSLIVGLWLLVALLFTAQFYFAMTEEDPSVGLTSILLSQVVHWGLWIVFTPVVLRLTGRVSLVRRPQSLPPPGLSSSSTEAGQKRQGNRWVRWLLTHLAASVVVAVLHLFLSTVGLVLTKPFPRENYTFFEVFLSLLGTLLFVDVLIYWAVLGVGHAVDFYRKYREGELHALHLKSQLAEAQVQALKMQLHPHFLFNTLNAVATLVRTGQNKAATDMIAGLSDLLRLTLESGGTHEVSLKQELEFLERYLEIEQIRFGERLRVQMHIDPGTLHARVPNLVLQPLVENAVRHGIAPRASAGVIEIQAERENGFLRLEVRDDGPGLPDEESVEQGVGLSTTRARLRHLYGAAQGVTLGNAEGGGAVVTLRLPFHES